MKDDKRKEIPATEMFQFQRGRIIRHKSGGQSYVVDNNFGERATAVATKDITNPSEWLLVG